VTGNTFCFGFIQGACRIGSGSRQSVCPTTNGTISVVTGYTPIDSCIRGTGLGRIRISVGMIEAQDVILVIIPEPGPGPKTVQRHTPGSPQFGLRYPLA